MAKHTKIRVLLAKVGLDGHERGVVIVARALRDAGMEVIYLGRRQMPEQIIHTAIQEDVDVIGLSSLTDAHMSFVPRVINLMKKRGIENVLVLLGGFIQEEDVPHLQAMGVDQVFNVGTKLDEIIEYINSHYRASGRHKIIR